MRKNKENRECFLGNHVNKAQNITDEDIELFKQKNNLTSDKDAIEFLLNKMSVKNA